ncbi:MAG: methylenetetrahydrofolate reductase [NAD(P)H] [Acidimicrobiia bacterium]|nr:methylenetetrahydrofolate reductase [Acidimicrobiia bacterium]NNF09984.1 methylenetetrahydrofolate reductase [NAD(P)H] [Acidimicrobiia bacterium]NNL71575.1 methylenetetrahydrofolate reductase [NAD(P)H] [Acidimicrobiia bacterium]
MRVTEHLERAADPFITFEIIPPTRGGDLASLLGLIEELITHRPPFIDITSHAAEVEYVEGPTGYQKRIKRKRPGTLGVCALIQNKFNVDAVPHILCEGFTRQETEDFLIELRYLDIDNVLAIRGDSSGYEKRLDHGRSRNLYATDLITQITEMNKGIYLEDLLDAAPTEFCIGAAGYPEKHFEAPNLTADIARVKQKVDAGAEYIVTQMFFDNRHYFDFVEACRAQGITVPIIPGIKILATQRQVVSIPRTFHCEIPAALADEVMAAPEADAPHIGIEWATVQTRELLEAGVPSVHFYVMQSARLVNGVLAALDV